MDEQKKQQLIDAVVRFANGNGWFTGNFVTPSSPVYQELQDQLIIDDDETEDNLLIIVLPSFNEKVFSFAVWTEGDSAFLNWSCYWEPNDYKNFTRGKRRALPLVVEGWQTLFK